MAWNNPRTWTPGELVTALMMNQHVRDNLNYLKTEHSAGQFFRGLHLQTHPDFDLEASRVMLVRADEIVMHDGARIADWNNLVANIATGGAGGLDTGAEAASTWYEILAIRNSSSGAKGLMLHRAKDWLADTSFTTAPNSQRALRVSTSTATDKIAQGFQLATAGLVEFVDVWLDKDGAPSGNVWFTIETNSGGSPSGTVLATSDKVPANGIASDSGQGIPYRIVFRTPPSLAASTQYHLVLQGDYAKSDTVWVAWSGVIAGGYANGESKDYNGTTWAATPGANGLDRNFRVYVTRNDAAATMPSGYDQRALVGWVYNDSGSNFRRFFAVDRDVWQLVSNTASITTALPNLVIDALLPPVRVVARASAVGSVANNIALAMGISNYFNFAVSYALAATPVAGNENNLGEFITEKQAFYAAISGGTGNVVISLKGFRW